MTRSRGIHPRNPNVSTFRWSPHPYRGSYDQAVGLPQYSVKDREGMHTENAGPIGVAIFLSFLLRRDHANQDPEGTGDSESLGKQRTPRQRRGLLGILANLLS